MGTALTFQKQERLCSKRLIDDLFMGEGRRSLASFPLRAVFKLCPADTTGAPIQVLISVPKRYLHHAVDRNRVKRQVREAYRKHHQELTRKLESEHQSLLLAFLWLDSHLITTAEVEARVVSLLGRISEKL